MVRRLAPLVIFVVASCRGVIGLPSSIDRLDAGEGPDVSDLPPVCGDHIVERGEDCDDGDQIDTGNGCSADCKNNSVCGDGTVQSAFEDCDDGNTTDDGNGCSASCKKNSKCGDGTIQSLFETCDDGDTQDTHNGCNAFCQRDDRCGDFITQSLYEQCDDGDTIDNGDGCDATCMRNDVCGDGKLQMLFEQCDDGAKNGEPGDPCDATCKTLCGNGVVDPGEACDPFAPGSNGAVCQQDCGLYEVQNAITFDLAPDGSRVYVSRDFSTGDMSASCLDANGVSLGKTSPFPGTYSANPQVRIARNANPFVFAYDQNGSTVAVLYDHTTCGLIKPLAVPAAADSIDADIDENGNSAVAVLASGDAKVYRFGADGTLATTLDFGACLGNLVEVSLSATTSDGVVLCGGQSYRRFSATAFTDAAAVSIGIGPLTYPLGVSMADDDGFAIIGATVFGVDYHATFYSATGAPILSELVGAAPNGGNPRMRTEFYPALGYILGNDGTGEHYQYDENGVLQGCAYTPKDTPFGTELRYDGSSAPYELQSSGVLYRRQVDFSQFDICRAATCGDHTKQADEACDDGNLVGDDGCDAFCRVETCGDGRVTGAEACDDGNTKSGDGCDATCKLEAQTPPPPAGSLAGPDSPNESCFPTCDPMYDFAVARDGSLTLAKQTLTLNRIEAECFAPDHTLRRARFTIAEPIQHAYGIRVVAAAGHEAIVWPSYIDGTVHAIFLDGSCDIARHEVVLPNISNLGGLFAAAMDDSGELFLATEDYSGLTLAKFDATGALLGSTTSAAETGDALSIALDRATGAGVAVIQLGTAPTDTVNYRRFDASGAWIDAAPVLVASDQAGAGSAIGGMNDAGQFVVEWRASSGSYEAKFFNADGSAATSTPVTISTRFQVGVPTFAGAFGQTGHLATEGSDFILGDPAGSSTDIIYYRYGADGTFVSQHTFTPQAQYQLFYSLHQDDSGVSYFQDSNTIDYGTFF